MKTIINPDSVVIQMLGSPDLSEISEVHLSQFAVPYIISGRKLLYNTLTRECVFLNDEEYRIVTEEFTYDPAQPLFKYLADHRFLSAADQECTTYCSIVSLMRTLSRKEKISTYTILPTTFCNARCFYCYELNYHFTKMNSETENHVIQFIKDTHADKEIKIRWFGGEPLLGTDTIDRITDQLHQAAIVFHSEIVTNGSLFTEVLINKAKALWNLKKAQITLDGNEEEYNRRKNYYQSEPSPFKTVIRNIRMLQQAGIRVTIRLNVDFDNIDDLESLQTCLSGEFTDKEGISVYCHPVFDVMNSDKCREIFTECIRLEQRFHDSGFRIHSLGTQGKLKPYYCIASNPSCITIDPDGLLYGCEHCDGHSPFGPCDSDKLPARKMAITVNDVLPKCRTCPYLPDCTEFTDCPDMTGTCASVKEMQTVKLLSAFFEMPLI